MVYGVLLKFLCVCYLLHNEELLWISDLHLETFHFSQASVFILFLLKIDPSPIQYIPTQFLLPSLLLDPSIPISFSPDPFSLHFLFRRGQWGPAVNFQRVTVCHSNSLGCLGISMGLSQSTTQPNVTQSYHWETFLPTKDDQFRLDMFHF